MKRYQLPFLFLLIAVCIAPFPYGSIQLVAWSLFALAASSFVTCWALIVALGKGPRITLGPLKWPLIAFALAAFWILVQLSTLTPVAWHHPIWAMAGEALGESLAGRISIDPQAGWFALVRLSSYAVVFWLAVQYGSDSKLAERALVIFAVAGALAAGSGLLIWGAGISQFLWFDEAFVLTQTRYGSRLAMPFINPNHLASFSTLGLICSVGLIVGETRGLWRPDTGWNEKLQRFVDTVVSRRWYLLISALVYTAAIFFSQSRGGLIALLVGLLVLSAALLRRSKPTISRLVATVAVMMTVAGAIFAPSIGRFVDRVSSAGIEADQRLEIYANTVSAIEASPWLGYGYGGFPAFYRMYDRNDVSGVVEFAHSTVLEEILELGAPAAACLFIAILWPVVACWRGAGTRRRDQHLPAIAAGAAAAAVVHSMVDFPLQIPAIAVAFSLILGLGFAQSASSKSS